MTTIDFSADLENYKGIPDSPSVTLAKTLSEFLGTETEGKTMKLFGWHKTLQTSTELTMDDADKTDLKQLIENSKRLFVFNKKGAIAS